MRDELRADLARYPGSGLRRWSLALRSPGFYATSLYRLRHHIHARWPRALRLPATAVLAPLGGIAGWALGISLAPGARIGSGLYIGHWGGIRVGPTVVLGENCSLSPGVILGFGIVRGVRGEPTVGDCVYVAAGAKVFGPIRVGSDVAIGANAVVCRDVPAGVSMGGVPARIISRNGSADYLRVGQPIAARAAPSPVNVVNPPVAPRAAEANVAADAPAPSGPPS